MFQQLQLVLRLALALLLDQSTHAVEPDARVEDARQLAHGRVAGVRQQPLVELRLQSERQKVELQYVQLARGHDVLELILERRVQLGEGRRSAVGVDDGADDLQAAVVLEENRQVPGEGRDEWTQVSAGRLREDGEQQVPLDHVVVEPDQVVVDEAEEHLVARAGLRVRKPVLQQCLVQLHGVGVVPD